MANRKVDGEYWLVLDGFIGQCDCRQGNEFKRQYDEFSSGASENDVDVCGYRKNEFAANREQFSRSTFRFPDQRSRETNPSRSTDVGIPGKFHHTRFLPVSTEIAHGDSPSFDSLFTRQFYLNRAEKFIQFAEKLGQVRIWQILPMLYSVI